MSERRFAALRHKDFALLWGGNIVSRIGTQMRDVAIAWHVYVLTRSPLALGLVGAARVVPVIALALIGGMAADSFDRRRLMMRTQAVLAATSGAMALLAWHGIKTPTPLYALLAVAAAANAFDNPARQAFTVNLLPAEDLPGGLALGIVGWQVATVVGPAIGGILLAATSVEVIYAIDAASFLAVIAALAVIRARPPIAPPAGGAETPRAPTKKGILEAVRFLRTRPALVWLMIVDFLGTFFAGSMLLLPIFANEVFEVGARGLGWLASAPAFGALAASAWLSYNPPTRRYGKVVLVSVAAYGLCITGFGLARSFPLALALLAGSGAADAVSTVVRQIVRQTMTPDAMRGRMGAINMMFFMSGPQLGEVEAGAVAQVTTPRVAVTSGGIACVLVAVVVAAIAPSLRSLERSAGGSADEVGAE